MTVLDAQFTSDMRAAPEAVRRQDKVLAAVLPALAERLRRKPPQVVVTCARGSSAHAATFGKHLIERYLGIVVAAAAPNIATIYHRRLRLADQFFLAISQSGESSDIIEQAVAASKFHSETALFEVEADGATRVLAPGAGKIAASSGNPFSALRTVELILGLHPMTVFDAAAPPLAVQ